MFAILKARLVKYASLDSEAWTLMARTRVVIQVELKYCVPNFDILDF